MPFTSVKTKRWTREQYYRMAELGWFNGRRVELIDGEVIEMSPQKRRHGTGLLLAQKALEWAFGAGFTIQVQLPLALDDESEPEPDLAVVRGGPRDYLDHPTSALLVVEVSETTLDFDLGDKASLYARYGIEDYWVLNLVDRSLIVHRQPIRDDAAPMGHRYSKVAKHSATASVSPLAAPQATISVADLLP